MRADNRLSPGDRELIAAYVSSRNKTVFCEHSHRAFAALQLDGGIELVEDVKRDPDSAAIEPKLRALLHIAGKVAVVVLVLVGALFLGACGGDKDDAADTSAASTTATRGERIVIRTSVVIAATSGAEPIATGEVLERSTLGGSPFCPGGTIQDSHGSSDPSLRLIVETITCPDGTVSMAFTPDEAQGLIQTGSWMIVGGTGAFEGLHGSGEMEVVYDPADDSAARPTFTGTVTR